MLSWVKNRCFRWYLLLGIFLTLLQLQSPRFFCWDDNATYFSGAYDYNYQSIFQNQTFPWLVWETYSGQSNPTQSQNGVFYPPAYLATALSWLIFKSPFWNIDLLVIFHLFLGAWGMRQYLKPYLPSSSLQEIAPLLYVSSPFLIVFSKSWVFVSATMAYMPWVFKCIDSFLHQRTLKSLYPYLLIKSLFFMQGYSQSWILLSFLEGLYLISKATLFSQEKHSLSEFIQLFKIYFLAQIIHLILILPQFWINLLAVSESAFRKTSLSLEQILAFRIDGSDAFLSQLFIFLPERYLQSSSAILHLGGSLFIFYLLYFHLRNRISFSQSLKISLLFLIITFVLSTSLHMVLTWIPPFHILRWPIKWMMFLPFFYTAVFVLLIQETSFWNPKSAWRNRITLIALFLQMTILLFPQHQKPLSSLRYQSWEDFKTVWNYQGGRVAPVVSDEKYATDPQLLAYNYGIWAGIPTLGGYDQLISRKNINIALGLQISSALEFKDLPENKDHLSRWGVRYFTASSQDPVGQSLDSLNWLKKVYSGSRITVYENLAALPLVSWKDSSQEALRYSLKPDQIQVDTEDKKGTLRIAFAPLTKNLDPGEIIVDSPQKSIDWNYPKDSLYLFLCWISGACWVAIASQCLNFSQYFCRKE